MSSIITTDIAKVEELEVYYRKLGNNKNNLKVLVLHGWNDKGAVTWEDFLEYFFGNFKNDLNFDQSTKSMFLLCPDMPGFGQSSPPTQIWSSQSYAQFIHTFLNEVEFLENWQNDEFLILGHSFGGAISMFLSQLLGQKYKGIKLKLVLLAPAIVREPLNTKKKILRTSSTFFKSFLELPILSIFKPKIQIIWRKIFGLEDYSKSKGIMTKIMQIVVRTDLQYALDQVSCQTLLIWGDKDTYTPIHQAKIIQNKLPNCQLKVLPNINHGLHIHAIKEVTEYIQNFYVSK